MASIPVSERITVRRGRCNTHGLTEIRRRLPPPYVPLSVYTLHRAVVEAWPCRCPDCGARLEAAAVDRQADGLNEEENACQA
jgi:hypothetical protein